MYSSCALLCIFPELCCTSTWCCVSLVSHPSAITTTACQTGACVACPSTKLLTTHASPLPNSMPVPCTTSLSFGPTNLLFLTCIGCRMQPICCLLNERIPLHPLFPGCSLTATAVCMQEEACRLAEQVHALEDTRSRWNAEVAAKEASLAAKEEAMAADSRQRDADQRRRLAQEHQVCICTCPYQIYSYVVLLALPCLALPCPALALPCPCLV